MIINIFLKNNRSYKCDETILGKTFENNATILRFHLTNEMADKNFYIEFEKDNGEKLSTPKLNIESFGEELGYYVNYPVPNSLLNVKGSLKAEVVLRDDTQRVFKSYKLKFTILDSINATNEIAEQFPDFVSETQKVLDIIETDGTGNMYLANDGTYKRVSGGSGSGTYDYSELENKPSINNVELSNNKTLEELGIQPSGDYLTSESDPTVPSHVKSISEADISNWNSKSDFDGSYNSLIDKPTIPKKTSELTNDSSYVTETYVKNEIANAQLGGEGGEIDLSGYATKDDIPTKTSQLTNDSGYLTSVPSDYVKETELVEITNNEIEAIWNS